MLETWHGLNNDPKLNRYIWKYNDAFQYLKLTGNFWIEDKIVDIKRWLIFDDGKSFFWDYLDSTHAPIKNGVGNKWVNCIKFILNNGKEITVAEIINTAQKLPQWICTIEWFVDKLDAFWDSYSLNSYKNKVYDILWEIRVAEHEYFLSRNEQEKQRSAELINLLCNEWN